MTHVTCMLTACTPGSAPNPTLGNDYGKTFTFTSLHYSLLTIDSYILLLLDNNYLHVTEVYRIFVPTGEITLK